MEFQKIIYLLNNTPNQSCKFKTKNWVEINYASRVSYNNINQIRFETSILRSTLCDYIHSYILVKRTITVAKAIVATPNNANRKVIFKSCAPFTKCISRINNAQEYLDFYRSIVKMNQF